jgi:hypothetical protein
MTHQQLYDIVRKIVPAWFDVSVDYDIASFGNSWSITVLTVGGDPDSGLSVCKNTQIGALQEFVAGIEKLLEAKP